MSSTCFVCSGSAMGIRQVALIPGTYDHRGDPHFDEIGALCPTCLAAAEHRVPELRQAIRGVLR